LFLFIGAEASSSKHATQVNIIWVIPDLFL
jgi:hypothetical protein